VKIGKLPSEDVDWLGIHVTRLNAYLLRTIFRKVAYPVILDNPQKPVKNNWRVLIAAGWKPGWSTDYISILLAKRFKTNEVIAAGDVPFVYNKDPRKYKNATKIKEISWENYQKLIGVKWIPGINAPIDPVATKLAKKLKLRALIIRGTEIKNFEKILSALQTGSYHPTTESLKFRGTIIGP
jgi:uridylate kinase